MVKKTVIIVTGEASGDIYGGKLVKAMSNKIDNIDYHGIGASDMEAAGVKIIINSKKLSIMGISEILPKILFIIYSINKLKNAIKRLKPKLLILIDFPDFNLNIASIAKKMNIPILYYVSPQIWAWRSGRIKKIKKLVDHMAVILPFEETLYKRHNIPVTFVGHPMLNSEYSTPKTIKRNTSFPTIGLLPGSREKEVSRLLPIMLESIKKIKQNFPMVTFIISHAKSITTIQINKIIDKYNLKSNIIISSKSVEQLCNECDLLIATSGTVTLEAALNKTPTIIVYKMSLLSFLIGKLLVKVKHIGLVNLLLNKRIFPELIQNEASHNNIAKTSISLLKNKKKINIIIKKLLLLEKRLGRTNASKQVATIAIKMLR